MQSLVSSAPVGGSATGLLPRLDAAGDAAGIRGLVLDAHQLLHRVGARRRQHAVQRAAARAQGRPVKWELPLSGLAPVPPLQQYKL